MDKSKNAARQSGVHNSINTRPLSRSESITQNIRFWDSNAQSLIDNNHNVIPTKFNSKYPAVSNWTANDRVNDASMHSGKKFGIGVLTNSAPAIDIDARDDVLATEFSEIVVNYLTRINKDCTVLKRQGLAPKVLIPCRLKAGSALFSKLTSAEFYKDNSFNNKDKNQLEILASGAFYVAQGIHPDTNRPYQWLNDGRDLTNTSLSELPELDEQGARYLIDQFQELAKKLGLVEKKVNKPQSLYQADDLANLEHAYINSEIAGMDEAEQGVLVKHVTSAINFLCGEAGYIEDRGLWIEVGHALACAKGTAVENSFYDLYVKTVCDTGNYEQDIARWEGFNPTQTNYKAIFSKAQARDWQNPAKGQSIGNNLSQKEKLAVSLDRFGHWEEVVHSRSFGDLKAVHELMAEIAKDCELGATERNLLAGSIKKVTKEKLRLNQPIADIRKAIKYKDARLAEAVVIDLDPDPFSRRPKNTIENFALIMEHFGVEVRYNKMTKRDEIKLPYSDGAPDTEDQAKLARVTSLLEQVSMPTGHTGKYISAVANANAYNPVESYLLDGTWDGKDRIGQFCDELVTPPNFNANNKKIFITRWLLSCVGAVLSDDGYTDERQFRYVLTLQGGESIGKTTWLLNLLPSATRRKISGIVKTALSIDPRDPNSVKEAISCWIGEVGELDATLNKADLGRLKGFLSNNVDSPRRLYVNDYSPTPRRTVWCASVNGLHFLDDSDNTRFMVIPLVSIARNRPTDRDQLWFQIVDMYKKGEVGELTKDEQLALIESNKSFRKPSIVREAILETFDWSEQDTSKWSRRGLRKILELAGFTNLESRRFDPEGRHVLQDLCKGNGITPSNGKIVYLTPPLAEFEDFKECKLA